MLGDSLKWIFELTPLCSSSFVIDIGTYWEIRWRLLSGIHIFHPKHLFRYESSNKKMLILTVVMKWALSRSLWIFWQYLLLIWPNPRVLFLTRTCFKTRPTVCRHSFYFHLLDACVWDSHTKLICVLVSSSISALSLSSIFSLVIGVFVNVPYMPLSVWAWRIWDSFSWMPPHFVVILA